MQFPWMMYRKGPGLDLPRGQRVSCQPANDETEYAAAIEAGWFPSVPEALAGAIAPPAVSGEGGVTPPETPTAPGQPASPPPGEQTKPKPRRPRKS